MTAVDRAKQADNPGLVELFLKTTDAEIDSGKFTVLSLHIIACS